MTTPDTAEWKTLGEVVRTKRDRLGLSAQKAAQQASMSTAYLLRLEAGKLKRPSPFVLNKVANALQLEYTELMRLAGYLVKSTTGSESSSVDPALIALFADLSEKEIKDVTEYVRWRREQSQRAEKSE